MTYKILHECFTIEKFVSEVCDQICSQAIERIESTGRFTLVLSGGNTPVLIFKELAHNYLKSIDWSKVHFFWVDERCVEPVHPESNYGLAYDLLISKIGKMGSVHRMKGELQPKEGAGEYVKDLISFFGNKKISFDMILLGMGKDGHVASIFSGSKELELKKELVLATEKEYGGHFRITLGIELINRSRMNLLLANNKEKLNVLNSQKESYPINLIKNVKILKLL